MALVNERKYSQIETRTIQILGAVLRVPSPSQGHIKIQPYTLIFTLTQFSAITPTPHWPAGLWKETGRQPSHREVMQSLHKKIF